VAKTVLTNDPSVVLTLLRVDRAIAAAILINGQPIATPILGASELITGAILLD
jgi:hypothetical protein